LSFDVINGFYVLERCEQDAASGTKGIINIYFWVDCHIGTLSNLSQITLSQNLTVNNVCQLILENVNVIFRLHGRTSISRTIGYFPSMGYVSIFQPFL